MVVIDGQIVVGFNRPRIDQLLAARAARRPQLGVSVADASSVSEKLGHGPGEGAYVGKVTHLSPGDKAGLAIGDVIVALGGQAIRNADDLESTLGTLVPGESVSLVYLRDGERTTARVTP